MTALHQENNATGHQEEHHLSLGERLRQARSAKGASLMEAGEALRIHATTLAALEEDNREALPAPVYTRGFIRIYASYLGLDPEQALQQHIEEQGLPATATTQKVNIQEIMTAESMAEAPRRVTGNHVFALLLLLVLGFLGYWSYNSYYRSSESPPLVQQEIFQQQPTETAKAPPASVIPVIPQPPQVAVDNIVNGEQTTPEGAENTAAETVNNIKPQPITITEPETGDNPEPLPESPTPEPAAGTEEPQPATFPATTEPAAAQEEATEAGHQLEIRFTEDTWLRIQIDDQPTRELFFEAGASHSWEAEEEIELRIGNAGGVEVIFDGTPMPSLGPSGRVINLRLP
ncbi:MAG: DUF4115 domain-containing protein [Desulfurivibrio sp.]|nr:DUF4115 domain-containing protein [Desulfurivibrio sp.]